MQNCTFELISTACKDVFILSISLIPLHNLMPHATQKTWITIYTITKTNNVYDELAKPKNIKYYTTYAQPIYHITNF